MRKESVSRKCFHVFNIAFMIGVMVVMAFPYLNILAKSLNEGADAARGGIVIWPRVFTWENYDTVISDKAFPRAAVVSILRVLVGTIISLVLQFMAAYALSFKHLRGRNFILLFLMIPMYFGGGLIPTYIFYANMSLLNNYILYVLPGAFTIYNTVIIRSYMNTLPEGLKEAARIDGASQMTILWRIMVPLCKPIMATIALWRAVTLWCDWTTTMYYFNKKEKFTLQYILVQVLKEAEKMQAMLREALMRGESVEGLEMTVTTESVRCAQIIVTTLPIVIVYPFLQKYFIQGVTIGAVKD